MSILGSGDFISIVIFLVVALGILAISISVHEASHAWVAERLGDPTAKLMGRVSLNPMDHVDPIGTVLLPLGLIVFSIITSSPLFLFGWAKPTPFNPWNLQNPRRDSALISFAGPLSNFAIAVVVSLVFRTFHPGLQTVPGEILVGIVELNLILGIFNLIPIHPLDGFKVVGGLLPRSLYFNWMQLERYGPILLLALLILGQGVISAVITPFFNFFLSVLLG